MTPMSVRAEAIRDVLLDIAWRENPELACIGHAEIVRSLDSYLERRGFINVVADWCGFRSDDGRCCDDCLVNRERLLDHR